MVEQETDAVIRQRFGVHGLRLFRLLYLHRQLEQKQIAEQAMLPPKVILLIHSCPCCLAVSVYEWAACITNSWLLDLFNGQLNAVGKLQQRTLPTAAPYVDSAFMHDVTDHLCWRCNMQYDC